MADKKYKIGRGERVTIEINRSSLAQIAKPKSQNKSKGLISSRKNTDYLARRKKGGFIQFYDLGQILIEGVWNDVDIAVVPNIELNGIASVRALILDDFVGRDEQLLAVGAANLQTTYRKIERAHGDAFIIEIGGDGGSHSTRTTDAAWTANGMKLTPDELSDANFRVTNFYADFYDDFILTGTGKNHITSGFDFEADAVSFTPKATDIYFLLPKLCITSGHAEYTEGGFERNFHINYFYRSHPRRALFDTEYEYYGFPATGSWQDSGPENNPDNYLAAWQAALINRNFDYSRARLKVTTGFGVWTWEIVSPDDFPPTDVFPAPPATGGNAPEADAFVAAIGGAETTIGALVAIIKQGSSFFYVWK